MEKKLIILICAIIIFRTIAYSNEIQIENILKIDDTLILTTKSEMESYNWKIEKKPFFSELEILESNISETKIKPDIKGEYLISIGNGEKTYKSFYVNNNIEKTSFEIFKEIKELKDFDNRNVALTKLIKNYPESKYVIISILNIIKNNNPNEVKEFSKYLIDSFKLLPKEKTYVYEQLYLAGEDCYLKELSKVSYKDYKAEFAKRLIKNGDDEVGLKILREIFIRTYRDDIRIELAKELEGKDSVESLKLFKYFDDYKYAQLSLKSNLDVDIETLSLSDKEKQKIEDLVRNSRDERGFEEYIQIALDNVEVNRFELAEIYFNNVLDNSNNVNLKKTAHFNLAKMYYLDRKYEKSISFFEDYLEKYADIDDVEPNYYLGIIYYNLGNYSLSKKYFEEIAKIYPYTIWETRAKIYMQRIENAEGEEHG